MNVDIYGLLPSFDGPYFAPYMTHVAPKWHLAVEQGNSRHGRAAIADAMSQDNAIGLGIHSDSGWGFGPFEEKRFAQSRAGLALGLKADFSIGEYARGLLNITWSQSDSNCQPHVDMLGLYGPWVIAAGEPGSSYPHAAGIDNLTLSECCEWCGNTSGCTGYTDFFDPAIHGRPTCMITNQTAFRAKEPRNVTGGVCAPGQCTAAMCGSLACPDRVAAELTPSAGMIDDAIVHAFVEFVYSFWKEAWRDVSLSTKAAAKAAGNRGVPATYGNVASPTPIAILESPWHDVWWMETGYGWTNRNAFCSVPDKVGGGTSLEIKMAQAAMRGVKAGEGTVWRCGGVRCLSNSSSSLRAARTYFAESIANNAVEWLLEGYNYGMTLEMRPTEEKNYARFLTSWRSAFIDRTRVVDGALFYSLPSTVWRNAGPLSHYAYPGSRDKNPSLEPNLHERDLGAMSSLLESSQVAYEVTVFDHPTFFNNSGGLGRLKPPSAGGYDWIVMPSTDAMSDAHIALVKAYVRGGGRAIMINSGNQSCGTRDEELKWRPGPAFEQLEKDPGLGSVFVVDAAVFEAFVACTTPAACDAARDALWLDVSAALTSKGGAQPSVTLSGAAGSSVTVNVWRHGAGPMLSVHIVNYDSSEIGNLSVSVKAAHLHLHGEFEAKLMPVARSLSLDTAGAAPVNLSVTVSKGQRLPTRLPEDYVQVHIPCCTSVHTLIIFASSEEEFQCRESAAQARRWLQTSMLAYRSHALRQAAHDGSDMAPFVTQWSHLRNADALLGQLREETRGTSATYRNLQAELVAVTGALKATVSSIGAFVAGSESAHRGQVLEMCKAPPPNSCLRALDFNGGADSPAGFVPLGAHQAYDPAIGFGFVDNSTRLAFRNELPDALHRSGLFSADSSTIRVDVDLVSGTDSLVLTLVSGWHDLGNQKVSAALGINGSACRVSGTPGDTDTCTRDRNFFANHATSSWTGFASTAVSVAVVPAHDGEPAAEPTPPSSCMLGAAGRGPGHFHTRSCRVNVSAARSTRVALEISLAPDGGTTGCWSHQCGITAFAWLANALVVQAPVADVSGMPVRAAASLAASDSNAKQAIRHWSWLGAFDNSDGDALDTVFPVERDLLRWPPRLNLSYAGKHGRTLSWKEHGAPLNDASPYLPLSRLLPSRSENTGSAAFAVARVWCATGGSATLRAGMSGPSKMRLGLCGARS